MLIEIRKIPKGERKFESEIVIDGKKVPIKLKTERDFEKISCLAVYETEIECECARCLEEFNLKISGEVRFFIALGNTEFNDDDFDFYKSKNENDKIDFTQTIYDDIFTKIPMKLLCKENCAGIVIEEKK
jgi:uncharacterized metal-binding protein YceD (DUF177 family)